MDQNAFDCCTCVGFYQANFPLNKKWGKSARVSRREPSPKPLLLPAPSCTGNFQTTVASAARRFFFSFSRVSFWARCFACPILAA